MIHKKKSFSILCYTATFLFVKIQKEAKENNIIDKILLDLKIKNIIKKEIIETTEIEYNFQN